MLIEKVGHDALYLRRNNRTTKSLKDIFGLQQFQCQPGEVCKPLEVSILKSLVKQRFA